MNFGSRRRSYAMMEALTKQIGSRATLQLFQNADHSFHVPASTGRKDEDVMMELLDVLAKWIEALYREIRELQKADPAQLEG